MRRGLVLLRVVLCVTLIILLTSTAWSQEEFPMSFSTGWSMVSLPVTPLNPVLSSLFPDAIDVYSFKVGIGYEKVQDEETLEVKKGYWIFFNNDPNYQLSGDPVQGYTLSITEDGWVMIGGCTSDAEVSSNGCSIGVIYDYVPGVGYQQVLETENLMPKKGYWILLNDITGQAELSVKGESLY